MTRTPLFKLVVSLVFAALLSTLVMAQEPAAAAPARPEKSASSPWVLAPLVSSSPKLGSAGALVAYATKFDPASRLSLVGLIGHACWVAVTPNGRFAYVTNTGSGSISGYSIGFDGTIEQLDADGRTAVTGDGSAPIDLAITDSGRFMYSLNSGTHTIGAFLVHSDGSLTPLPFLGGLPTGASGLAAR